MILINKAVGSVRLPDIQFTLHHKQIVKISDVVEDTHLQKSLLAPSGSLHVAKQEGLVRIVFPFDHDYKYYDERVQAQVNFIDPETRMVKTREGAIKFFSLKSEQERIEFLSLLGYIYYDFFIEMRAKLTGPANAVFVKIIDEKIESFKDLKTSENFVLLDLT